MPAVFIIGGLIVLFLAAKSSQAKRDGSAPANGPGSNTGLPDPGAAPSNMGGQATTRLSRFTGITPFAGTARVSPGTQLGRLNGANRVALNQVGRVRSLKLRPLGQTVRTTNPAVVPFSGTGTRAFSGTVATSRRGAFGPKL